MANQSMVFEISIIDKSGTVLKQFSSTVNATMGNVGKKTKGVTGAFSDFGKQSMKSFRTAAQGLIPMVGLAAAFTALRKVMISVVTQGREFEKQFANVLTLSGDLSDFQKNEFREGLIGISAMFGTTTELAKGLYHAVSAGVAPGAAALGFLEKAAVAASAGLSDLSTTTKAIASVMNAYGMSTKTAAEAMKGAEDISDILFVTIKRGLTTMPELVKSLGRITATAAATGVSFEQVGAAVATLTKKGMTTRWAIQGLNRLLMIFLKPTAAATKAAKEMGIEFSAVELAMTGIPGIINLIKGQFTDIGPEIDKMTIAGKSENEIFKMVAETTGKNVVALRTLFANVAALRSAIMLTNDQGEEFNSIYAEMEGRAGATWKAFKEQAKTANFWLDALAALWEKVSIRLWDGLTSHFLGSMGSVEEFQKKFDDFADDVLDTAVKIGIKLGEWAEWLRTHIDLIIKVIAAYALWKLGAGVLIKSFVSQGIPALVKFGKVLIDALGSGVSKTFAIQYAVKTTLPIIATLAKGALVAGAAFVSWKLTRFISEVTGLDKVVVKAMENFFGLDRMHEKMNKEIADSAK